MWKTELLVFRVGWDIHPGSTDVYEENFAAALRDVRERCLEEGVRAWVESQLMEEL